ncbi:MAG: hypothetical protein JXB88_21755 [Spirochaetales bacterium]|nr:hypothetical protein [Spirochaetales bacterium]
MAVNFVAGKPAVLFLDQFEQIFDRVRNTVYEQFIKRLETASRQSNGKLKVCIIIRTDYFGLLYPYLDDILPHPITGYRNKEEICDIVEKFAKTQAAGDDPDFDHDMWKMLEWWNSRK